MYDLDRTQEWLNRTQALARVPAMRGGLSEDRRPYWQAAVGAAAVLLFVVFLIQLSGWRPRAAAPPPAPSSLPTASLAPIQSHEMLREVAPDRLIRANTASASVPETSYQPPIPLRDGKPLPPDTPLLPPGYVSPPAPVWLDGPQNPRAAPPVASFSLPGSLPFRYTAP
jgi:hypothetical protein